MRFGIIGTGWITHAFLDGVYKNGGELVAIYSRKEETALKFGEKYQVTNVYTNMEEFLKDPMIDVVYIASPNSFHYPQTKQALLAGKHVVVEKPVASSVDEWEDVMAICKEKNLFLFEAITTQHLPNYKYIKEVVNQIGRIRLVQSNFSQYSSKYNALLAGQTPNVFNPAFSGGCLSDINVYNVHFVVGIFGLPNEVKYFANKHPNGIDLSGIVVMSYEDFICQCSGAKDSASYNYAQIQGEKGYILVKSSTSMCLEVELHIGNEVTTYNVQEDMNALYYENIDFKQIIENKDYALRDYYLNESLNTMKVLEAARHDANIKFAN